MHLVTFYIFYTNICGINITAIKNHEFQKKEYTDLPGSANIIPTYQKTVPA